MPPTGPDDRKESDRRIPAREGDSAQPRDAERSESPPGIREESPPDTPRYSEEAGATAAEGVGETADPDAAPSVHRDSPALDASRADVNRPPQPWEGDPYPPGYGPSARPAPPQSAQRYDRFGWPIPEGIETNRDDQRPAPPPAEDTDPRDTSSWRVPPEVGAAPSGPYSGQFPAQQPAPTPPPRGPYSGQFPTQPPRQSGAFPVTPPDHASRSGALPIPPVPPDNRRSGSFPAPPADPVYQSGSYAVAASGPIPQSPYISGPIPRIGERPGAMRRSGPLPYSSEVTSTGSRRVIVAPDAGVGSLLVDRSALAFLLAAVVFVGAMIAFIALRYAHFPNQIALHFGPAGSSQPNRIGEKRELWTIPFIVGIVLAANTALAWAVYRYDRFAARLLTLGCALVAAIAWVVLLTLLHR
ncbi:MAG: DUF1648 domain-containing protein [Thermomicrobiales bacterium]